MQTIVKHALLLTLAFAASDTVAQDNRTIPVETLARGCASCHGTHGESRGAIPPLAGQDAAWLESRMVDFRNQPESGTIMPRLVAGLSDSDIAALAAWFAEQPQ